MKAIITGGAGFIGSALARHLVAAEQAEVVIVDKLSYAASLTALDPIRAMHGFRLVQQDICDQEAMSALIQNEQPDLVFHLAAETHVDRSITGSHAFVQTNVMGTHALLEATRAYWLGLPSSRQSAFRFVHISTDEVFGSAEPEQYFSETTKYDPSSPYSASKAASDHLVMSWHRTYGLPVIISNCSNNYGPYQFPEKLIPLMVLNAREGKPLPVYGDGQNIRDWLYVEDHVHALMLMAEKGKPGTCYTVGGASERTNLEIVKQVCALMDTAQPTAAPHSQLIKHVTDRLGHDRRYAVDTTRIETDLGWQAKESFDTGLEKTVQFYLDRSDWWQPIRDRVYKGERLGMPTVVSRASAD
ncbi:MAG: dTDP-glucose 4,6-dehydratase [Pseudomonadota bacterium]